MKIRQGFVSNSSSSSFAIFGVSTSYEEIAEKLNIKTGDKKIKGCEHQYDRETNSFCSKCGLPAWEEIDEQIDYETIEDACAALDLDFGDHTHGGFGIYVGVNINGVQGQDGLEMLRETNVKIKNLFGEEAQIFSGEYYS